MEAWLSYDPGDLLLFSEEVYRRLFERANAALAPWPALAPLALIAALAAARRAPRALWLLLAAGWAVAAAAFLPLYAEINWAAAYAIPAFWAQAALLLLIAVLPRGAARRRGASAARTIAGIGVVGAAAVWPLLAPIAGRPLAEAEVPLVAPDPTALATLGAAAAFGARRGVWLAVPIPALWCVASAATLATMGAPSQGLLVIGCALAALAALAAPRRSAGG